MKESVVRSLLDTFRGAKFVGVDIETTPIINKTMPGEGPRGRVPNPHFGRVTKQTKGIGGMIATNTNSNAYASMVKRRLAAEGKDPESFELSSRTWGVRIPDTPFVEHNGQLYVEVICQHPGKSVYLLDGQEVDASTIIGLRPATDSEQGGLENKVVIRAFKAESIIGLRVDGVDVKVK